MSELLTATDVQKRLKVSRRSAYRLMKSEGIFDERSLAECLIRNKRMPSPLVYFVQGVHTNRIKVGMARDVWRRLRDLRNMNADQLRLIGAMPGSYALETRIHRMFRRLRCHGEWFRPAQPLREFIDENAILWHPTIPGWYRPEELP